MATFDGATLTTNPTLHLDYFIVWTQAEMYYSLMSATVPILRPFMKNLNALHGGLGLGGTTVGNSNTDSRSRSIGNYRLSVLKSKLNSSHNRSETREEDEENMIKSEPARNSGNTVSQDLAHKPSIATSRDGKDAGSIQSLSDEHMTIRKDVSFMISHEARS